MLLREENIKWLVQRNQVNTATEMKMYEALGISIVGLMYVMPFHSDPESVPRMKNKRYNLLQERCAAVLGITPEELNQTKAGTPERAEFLEDRYNQKLKEHDDLLVNKRNTEAMKAEASFHQNSAYVKITKDEYLKRELTRFDQNSNNERAKIKEQYNGVCAVLNTPLEPIQQQQAKTKPSIAPPPVPPRAKNTTANIVSRLEAASPTKANDPKLKSGPTTQESEIFGQGGTQRKMLSDEEMKILFAEKKLDSLVTDLDAYISKLPNDFYSEFRSTQKYNEKNDAAKAFKEYVTTPEGKEKPDLSKHAAALSDGRLGKIVKDYDPKLFDLLKKAAQSKQEPDKAPKPDKGPNVFAPHNRF